MAIFRANKKVDCKKVKSLANSLDLTEYQSKRLYFSLCAVRWLFDMRAYFHATPKNSAVSELLQDIEKSVGRIATLAKGNHLNTLPKKSFDSSPKFQRFISELTNAANQWKKTKSFEDLAWLGLVRSDLTRGVHEYDSHLLVSEWFRVAPFMHDLMVAAINNLQRPDNLAAYWETEAGAKEWLCGKQLPEIYERYSRRKFGISKRADEITVRHGIEFVINAHEAIGLGKIAAEGVASHVKKARKRAG